MAERKYEKYFITSDNPNMKIPPFRMPADPKFVKRITQIDNEMVPGSEFFCETLWILPGFDKQSIPPGKQANYWEEHTHDFGELIGFYGFNYDDIMDLGAEIEFWVDGQKHIIAESFSSFIPAGIKHGPLTIRNVKKPLVHFIACTTGMYK
jgi:hypothetical protein